MQDLATGLFQFYLQPFISVHPIRYPVFLLEIGSRDCASQMVFKFTIDHAIGAYIPSSPIQKLPAPLRRMLGAHDPPARHDYFIWVDILVLSFCGIALLEGIFISSNIFLDHHHAPMIIASYGATAILCFNAVASPLAQPRNILVGHFVSSLIGVGLSKLFWLSRGGRENAWAGGALSVGIASLAMMILDSVHPPAGATALLPFVDEQIRDMGWWYLPVHLISSVLIICVALVTNNILRRYPTFWWHKPTPKVRAADSEKQVIITEEEVKLPEGHTLSQAQIEFLEEVCLQLRRDLGKKQSA